MADQMHTEGAVWFIGALLLVAAATSPAGQSQLNVCVDYGCDLEQPIRVSRNRSTPAGICKCRSRLPSCAGIWSRNGPSDTGTSLACKLHEGFGNQGAMGKAVVLIGRKSIAVAMV